MSAGRHIDALPGGFTCRRCGNCCRVEGYVRLTPDDVSAVAALLGMTVQDFTGKYTRLTSNRNGLSLTEHEDQSCVFLTHANACAIEDAKPQQCRDFPHTWCFEGFEEVCAGVRVRASETE